jgi:hypothetical protein
MTGFGEGAMRPKLRLVAMLGALLAGLLVAGPAKAQKSGGVLQMLDFASPASMSIHEESR